MDSKLLEAARPLMAYLKEHHDLHTYAHVDAGGVEIVVVVRAEVIDPEQEPT